MGETTIRIGESVFYNEDAIAGAVAHLADDSVDLIITDPPYGIDGDKLHRHYNRDERFVLDGYVEVPRTEYRAFTRAWIEQAARVLRPGGSIYVVSGYTNLYDVLDALRATNLREINHLIWKYNFGVYTSRKFVSSHYHILYCEKPGGKRTFHTQARFATDDRSDDGGNANYADREDVFVINREYKPGKEKNKNELPRELLKKLLQYSSNPGDLVCDFFMGGGSTAEVAIGMNRRFAGFELSAKTFVSRVPRLRKIAPGELLASLQTPKRMHRVANAGKAWSARDIADLQRRFRALSKQGKTKREIVATLGVEFERGSWSIVKRLKTL